MLPDTQVQSPFHALLVSDVLTDLHNRSPLGEIEIGIRAMFGGMDFLEVVPETTRVPRYLIGRFGSSVFVGIDGIQSAAQAGYLVGGYAGGNNVDRLAVENLYLSEIADTIVDRLRVVAPTITPPLFIGGYSMGGAVAVYLPRSIRAKTNVFLRCGITSFGAPRAAGADLLVTFRPHSDYARWMNSRDPIPWVPPSTIEGNGWLTGRWQNIVPRLLAFRHTEGGLVLGPDGSVESKRLPDTDLIVAATDLRSWILDQENTVTGDHSLGEYRRRLILRTSQFPTAAIRGGAPQEAPRPLERREIIAAIEQQIDRIFYLEHRQNATPVVIPPAQRFKAVKRLRVWAVEFRGQLVTIAGSKKAARAIARRLNVSLDVLQHQAVVDTTAIIQQLQAYFDDAKRSDTGFVPPMNTRIDV